MKLRYKKLDPNLPDLRRGSASAAGIDLYTIEDALIRFWDSVVVSAGIQVEIPEGYFGQVSIRSGLGFKQNLATHHGVIDADFRGEVKLKIFNLGMKDVEIKKYDRVAQLVLLPYLDATPECVLELANTERGEGGYGSTGR